MSDMHLPGPPPLEMHHGQPRGVKNTPRAAVKQTPRSARMSIDASRVHAEADPFSLEAQLPELPEAQLPEPKTYVTPPQSNLGNSYDTVMDDETINVPAERKTIQGLQAPGELPI
jgi:hypothetical protein